MRAEESNKTVFMVIIAGRKQKERLLPALLNAGACKLSIMYGRGSVKASYIKSIFSFVPEENKVAVSCLLNSERADAIMKMLVEQFHFDKPNTGVAFTVAVDELSF